MAIKTSDARRTASTDAVWEVWAREHADVLGNSLSAQCVLLEAAVRFVARIEAQPILTRMAAFFLLHTDMGLTPAQVGAAVGRTDRAMRTVQALSAQDLLTSIWSELGRHRTPKLLPEHAGPIAKYLAEHPKCHTDEVLAFIQRALGIHVDRHTLQRFSAAYSLGVFRAEREPPEGEDERPFFSDAPASAGPSSCSRSPSG